MPQSTDSSSYYHYYLVPNLQALDPSAHELDPGATTWVQPTAIDDDDLTFGGKSLSTWYEEDRRRLSSSSGGVDCDARSGSSADDEPRGRERVRRPGPDCGRKKGGGGKA